MKKVNTDEILIIVWYRRLDGRYVYKKGIMIYALNSNFHLFNFERIVYVFKPKFKD